MTKEESKTFLTLKYGSVDAAFDLWLRDRDGFGDDHYDLFAEYAIKQVPILMQRIKEEQAEIEAYKDADAAEYDGYY